MFLWHQRLMHRFNWLWTNTTTYEHYDAETEYETLIAGGSNATQAQGTKNVLHSLTPNHRGILKLLANYLLNEMGSKSKSKSSSSSSSSRTKKNNGLDFYEFLTRCQADMLAHNDQVLRNHLTELLDHGLVSKKKIKNGQTLYYIPLAEEVIRNVILEEKSNGGADSP
jgi:origin recognition complex subunit 2